MRKFLVRVAFLCLLIIVWTAPVSAAEDYGADAGLAAADAVRSVAEVTAMVKRFPHTAFDLGKVTQYAVPPHFSKTYQAGVLDPADLTDALNTLKMFRYLAGVPYENISLTAEMNNTAQHKAVLLATTNQVSHFPDKPADMPASFYNTAQRFSKECAFGGRSNISNAVTGFIADGGGNNIEYAEHRMVLLDPTPRQFGFGYAQNPGTSYRGYRVIIHTRISGRESDSYVAWPSAGAFPIQYFAATANLPIITEYPWSIKLGSPYRAPVRNEMTLVLTRLRDGRQWTFDDSTPYLSENNMPEESTHLSVHGKEIVFRPDMTSLSAIRDGDVFTVNLSGIRDAGGKQTTLEYAIHFFDLDKAMDAAGAGATPETADTDTDAASESGDYAPEAPVNTPDPQTPAADAQTPAASAQIENQTPNIQDEAPASDIQDAQIQEETAPEVPKEVQLGQETRPESQPGTQTEAPVEKIRIVQPGKTAVQYNYYTPAEGEGIRRALIDHTKNWPVQTRVLASSNGSWFDVTYLTLNEATRQNGTGGATAAAYRRADSSGGNVLTPGAAELVDRINAARPLDAEAMRSVYSIYYETLSDAEKTSAAGNAAVLDMFAALGIYTRV